MINAIGKEIELSTLSLINEKKDREIIETVYFGGGTPSLLSIIELESILSALKTNFQISTNCEITLEANPDDILAEKLSGWKKAGVNRLSIGIQSFKEKDLDWMNRSHTKQQAIQSIVLAKNAGFNNLSVDLIYGTPGLSDEEWKMNVNTAIEYDIAHIACYALTVEPKTALQKMILLKKKADVNADDQARQFSLIMKWMKEARYEHYEISNFAKPGFRSRHNSSYWQRKKYLGFGPSAHSFDGKSRKWNVANNMLYIRSINENHIPLEEEKLTEANQLNEYIMTSLRTIEGMDLRFVENNFSLMERNRIENLSKKYVDGKMMTGKNDVLVLTDKGKLFADGIAADLFQSS
jgi:oxygen-independent coproporphyrinogen-3 oxidase